MAMTQNKNVACLAPFSALLIQAGNHTFPCCAYNTKAYTELNENEDLIWNFENTNNKIQQEFIEKGLDISNYTNCNNCKGRGFSSQNNLFNREANKNIDYIKNPTLTNLHIKFSNQCNLACRICSPGCSNLIYAEDRILQPELLRYQPEFENIAKDSKLNQSIFDNLDKLNYLWFSGGEPLLHEDVWILLTAVYEKGYSNNIKLKFNTNGTIKLSEEKYNILKNFKEVSMEVSMDGIGKHAEYIRTNVSWDRWVANLIEYQNEFFNYPNIKLSIVVTVSVFNIHLITEIKNFFIELNIPSILNYLTYPPQLCVYNINTPAKEYIKSKLQGSNNTELLNFINRPTEIDCNKVIKYIDKKDDVVIANNLYKNYRAFRDVDPEWYAMLKG